MRNLREDILALATHFLDRSCRSTSRSSAHLSREAADLLLRHDWPGNVRELDNAIEGALIAGRGTETRPADLAFLATVEDFRIGSAAVAVSKMARVV